MKKTLIGAVALVLMTACGGKQQTAEPADADTTRTEAVAADATMEDPAWHTEGSVKWKGHTYTYVLNRAADKSLPLVKDGLGQPYYDNSVDLSLRRDGEVFIAKRFTKEAFLEFLTPDYRANAALQGIAFDQATDEGLRFGAFVGYPGSEEGIPLMIIIASDGTMSVVKGEQPAAPGD